MRDYAGIAYATIPDPEARDFVPRLRSMLGTVDYYLRDASRGFARINKGEIPDGSGDPLGLGGTLNDYLYLPGRTGGQTLASWGLTIRSNTGGSSTAFTISAAGGSAPFDALRALDRGTDRMDFRFFASGGDGVEIWSLGSGTSGRLGVGAASNMSASIDVSGENGAAPCLELNPFSSSTGSALLITGGSATGTLTVTSANRLVMNSGAGQSAGTMALINNVSGNNATIPLALQAKSTQSGNLTEWRDSAGAVLSQITSAGAFNGPITSTSATSFLDTLFSLLDNADNTKILQFQLSGITTATTRTLTVPDASGTIATLENAHTVSGAWQLGPNDATTPITAMFTPNSIYDGTGFLLKDSASGFNAQIIPGSAAGLSANRAYLLPDASGTIVLTGQTVALTLSTTSIINVSSVGTGAHFRDNSTSTKRLYIQVSGAVGSNGLVFTNTAARSYTFTDAAGNVAVDSNFIVDAESGDVLTDAGTGDVLLAA